MGVAVVAVRYLLCRLLAGPGRCLLLEGGVPGLCCANTGARRACACEAPLPLVTRVQHVRVHVAVVAGLRAYSSGGWAVRGLCSSQCCCVSRSLRGRQLPAGCVQALSRACSGASRDPRLPRSSRRDTPAGMCDSPPAHARAPGVGRLRSSPGWTPVTGPHTPGPSSPACLCRAVSRPVAFSGDVCAPPVLTLPLSGGGIPQQPDPWVRRPDGTRIFRTQWIWCWLCR